MLNIAITVTLAKLPVAELQASIRKHVEPMTENLPDKRLGEGGDPDEIVFCLHNVTACSQSIDLDLKAKKLK